MRFNFRLNGSAEEFMDRLADKFNMQPKEVVLDSLAIMKMAIDEIEKNGGRLGIQEADGSFTAIITPTIAAVKKAPEKNKSRVQTIKNSGDFAEV